MAMRSWSTGLIGMFLAASQAGAAERAVEMIETPGRAFSRTRMHLDVGSDAPRGPTQATKPG